MDRVNNQKRNVSASNGYKFEFDFYCYLLHRGLICQNQDLVDKKCKGPINIERFPYFDQVFDFLSKQHGKLIEFKIFKDCEGKPEEIGGSSDLCLFYLTSCNKRGEIHLSLKNNSTELKAQRVWSVPDQLGCSDRQEYEHGLKMLLQELINKYQYAYIFSQLEEYHKKNVYWTINCYVADYITEYLQNNQNHIRYIDFLLGGKTDYILVNKDNRSEKHMNLYVCSQLSKDTQIDDVQVRDHIYISLSNGYVIKMRLHNDDRMYNANMRIKYSTTLLDMCKRWTVYVINKTSLQKKDIQYTLSETADISKEKLRRLKTKSK